MTAITVRHDALLLALTDRGTWRGYETHWLLASAGLCLDACAASVLTVGGSKLLGFDRRRVAAGPAVAAPDLSPLVARLARRVHQVGPESPVEWIRHCATFAPDAVLGELASAGTAATFAGRWHPFGRTAGLLEVDPVARDAAQLRVAQACAGSASATPQSVVTASLLELTDALPANLGGRFRGGARRHLARGRERLEPSLQLFLACLRDRRSAQDRVGGY